MDSGETGENPYRHGRRDNLRDAMLRKFDDSTVEALWRAQNRYRPLGGRRTGLRARRRFWRLFGESFCPGRHPPKGGTHVKRNFYLRLISAAIIAPDSALGSLNILFETSTRGLMLSDVTDLETILGMNRSGKERGNQTRR